MKITINNQAITIDEDTSILDAAKKAGISIPTLCHHPKLTPFGGCRLCIVKIEGIDKPVTSCNTLATDGMVIYTNTPELESIRKTILRLLIADHPLECPTCEMSGVCELQNLVYLYGASASTIPIERRRYQQRDANPFIDRNLEKCILCGRCVRICKEIQGVGAIDFAYKGFATAIVPKNNVDLSCEFCGQCVSVCPTGALSGKQWAHKIWQRELVDTVCPYCGTGCNITLHVRDNTVIKVTSPEDAFNEGFLCVKGRFGYSFINSPDRLKQPLIRKGIPKSDIDINKVKKDYSEYFRTASWDEALSLISTRLLEIKAKYGPDSIGGFASGRCTNEENYTFQKFFRAVIGTNNIDHCARL